MATKQSTSRRRKEPRASVSGGTDDTRFDSSKPQFRKTSEKASKVVLDDRFASVLTDPRFQLTTADKYGRKHSSKKQDSTEKLAEFYTVESKDEQPDPKVFVSKRPTKGDKQVSQDEAPTTESKKESRTKKEKGEKENPESRIAYLTALSRGEVDVSSSDDEESHVDDDSDDHDSEASGDVDNAGVLDPSSKDKEVPVEMTTEESPYMAVLNMDWSHVRAVDIFTILSSFTPPGAIKRVQVYPSDFGMERIKKEALFGPVDVWKKKKVPKTSEDDEIERYQSDNEDSARDDEDDYDDEDDEPVDDDETYPLGNAGTIGTDDNGAKSDFDPEKLRRYEASRLKYYFAIVEFSTPEHADIAYKQVDGMEFEHSSAAIDLRSIPVDGLDDVRNNRELRDEATMIPSNYVPPEFVVNALQQSNVQCTWDMGNQDRETLLTKYTSGQTWGQVTETDDLKVYLASDNSSDEEGEEEGDKATQMRKMLGLESDEDDSDDGNESSNNEEDPPNKEYDDDHTDDGDDEEGNMQMSFIPGQSDLAAKLRDKIKSKPPDNKDLSSWEKYQEKRKQKKREKRAATREKRKQISTVRKGGGDSTELDVDDDDDFFVAGKASGNSHGDAPTRAFTASSKEELDLLLAGDDNKDEERDFDMRGLERIEKNKDKKLHGARKRKEEKLTANIVGADFMVDTADERFKAVLEGTDDRFGIDRTDPNFKETVAMREILAEQSRHRKKKKQKLARGAVASVGEDRKSSTASSAVSALAKRVKAKIT